ncbi:RecQ family ATP-dependent DNA helicase [Ferruginibacter sp.]|nr:RecQ family ATP-dependent DNA helicase [Ferruginibacter sp.]
MTAQQILKQYWGYDAFRPLQEEIITTVLEGKDALALLPTGGGKSICFQVPAMAKDGLCLVVSPLIALMKDQVEQLKRRGIPALAVYSGMSFIEVKKTLQNAAYGNFKFLYVSPERLETKLFLEYLPSMNISLLAVDEAHCVSQWGYDFRPPYLRIANLREWLPGVPVLALTASATKVVQDDICDKLLFKKDHQRFQQSFERPNLSYSVFNVAGKQNKLLEILKNVPGTAIVYCKSRKHTKEIADLLRMHTINADFYHAGLSNDERNTKQENWITNKTRVIVCTNAFGMGIDKPDVRVVVHYDVPDCLENYYQEAGRAGRDGKKAYAVLLYSNKELNDLQNQSDIRFPKEADIKIIYTALMNHLQIAAGSGEGVNFDFDIAGFANAFKQNILTVTYAIKALEQEDIISFNEMVFKPSSVLFTANRSDLTEFEKIHPELEPMIKGLLRSYEGIFDYPATVYESQLAKFIRKDIESVKKELRMLNDYSIIAYTPQKDKPQLTLLQNRMYADNYAVNMASYLQRKKNFEQRVAVMLDYIKNTANCRSKLIATYFNAPTNKSCGCCDNCINEKDLVISMEEFESISAGIFQLVKSTALPVKEIQNQLKGVKKEKLWKVINYLQAENKLSVTKEGYLFL